MTQGNRFKNNRQRSRTAPPPLKTSRDAAVEKKPPTEYGKPFIVMEDEKKNTFDYQGGKWVPHPLSIAECRQTCLVKELPQKVKGMTRYEIQSPLPVSL